MRLVLSTINQKAGQAWTKIKAIRRLEWDQHETAVNIELLYVNCETVESAHTFIGVNIL